MNYLIRHADAIATDECEGATDIRIQQGRITEIGHQLEHHKTEGLIDAGGCVVYPGFVNTHHHLAQSVLKGVPEGLNLGLEGWLDAVPCRFWPHFTPELMYLAATIGLSELLRSGTTTCADHHYLYHSTITPELEDAVWQAAEDLGIRLVLCRGGATEIVDQKGMAQARIQPESIDLMLRRLDASRRRYHEADGNAMRKLVVAPTCLVHSAPEDGLRQLASYAREYHLKLHSHLLEVPFDEAQAQQKYDCTAVEFAGRCGWLGSDVWYAHLVQATEADIDRLVSSGTTIAHCPTSNCRLGSGIAPVIDMEQAGMSITLGVDGSASAESGSMVQEANLSWLLHRAVKGPQATTLERCFKWASANGARLLGLSEAGELTIGSVADLVVYDLSHYRFEGMHERRWAPLMAGEPVSVKASFVNGKRVVHGGEPINLDRAKLAADVQQALKQLIRRAAA
ncbi:amidohydrolase family protein [Aestuariicella hydrocarbonica]|uniref:Amidohydrolase family protein n=1 Tax=Pseudomaricurvus hydrocarbonicus TaxID=1470433 RepID=A0A9E5JWP7_9GAMM|nr:amidohydrolase family protein [Aestuariicella hydrocarbonica]